MNKLKSLFIAIILGVIQYVIGVLLVFYGTVIDPKLIHKIDAIVGFMLLLPFSIFIFAPLEMSGLDIVLGLMSLVFWIFVYYRLFRKLCRRKS